MEDMQKFLRGQIYWRKWDDSQKDVPGIISKSRPVLIVSNNSGLLHSSIATVVPLTTSDKSANPLPTHVKIRMNANDSYALCENVTTISQNDLQNYVGTVYEDKMQEIDAALNACLGISYPAYTDNSSSVISETSHASPLSERFSSRTWTTEMISEFLDDFKKFKEKQISEDVMLEKWSYGSVSSLYSAYYRFTSKGRKKK